MSIKDEVSRAFTDRGVIDALGKAIAAGLAESGNSTSFSRFNPTGETAGRAGGRGHGGPGGRDDILQAQADEVKARQAASKYANQLSKQFASLTKELQKGGKDLKQARRETAVFAHVFEDQWNKAMEKVSSSTRSEAKVRKRLSEALGQDVETTEDLLKLRMRQQRLENIIQNKRGGAAQSVIDEYNKLSEAMGRAIEDVDAFGESFVNNMKSGIRAFFSFEAALVSLSFATKQLYGDYQAQLKFGSQFSLWGQQMEAMQSGVDPAVMAELMAETRQASIAFGTAEEYMDSIQKQQWKYYNQIGDLTEAMKFTQDMYFTLGKSGIKPSEEAMNTLGGTFRVLNKIAGVTSEEFTQMISTISADEDITTRLRVAKASEREAIIAGIAKQTELNVAMGLTKDQAMAAALAMGKIAGGGAKERFKRAAQMQMAFGAMGIEGGAEAAALVRKGKQRLSPAETARLEELTTRLTEKSTAAMGGSIPGELVRDTILGKTGLDAYFGESSPLNKQLAEGLEGNKDVLENILEGIKDEPDRHHKAMMLWDKIYSAIANGGIVKGVIGIIQAIGHLGLLLGAGRLMGRMGGMGGMLGSVRNGVTTAGGAIMSSFAKGGAGRAALGFGARAIPVLGGAAMVGKDVLDLAGGDTSKENIGGVAGGGLGALIGGALGTFLLPGLGTAAGAGLGAMAGNWLGGLGGEALDNRSAVEQQERITDSTAELVDPAKRTAIGIENVAEILMKSNEFHELQVKSTLNMVTAQESRDRLRALQASGQIVVQDA